MIKDLEIDLTHLKELLNNEQQALNDALLLLVETCDQELETLKDSFDGQEWKKMASAAHTFKSKMRYINCAEAAELSREIEYLSKSRSDMPVIQSNFLKLQEIFSALKVKLESEIK